MMNRTRPTRAPVICSPSVLNFCCGSPGANGIVAIFGFPYDGKVGRGRVILGVDGEPYDRTAVITYKSPSGLDAKYEVKISREGIGDFSRYQVVEAGGVVTIYIMGADGQPARAGITSVHVFCGFVPSPAALLSIYGMDKEDA